MQAIIGFMIEKAPEGGYKLAKITSLDDGVQAEVVAYCSTLIEVSEIEHQKKTEAFGERAWHPPRREMPLAPTPYAVPPVVPNGHDGSDDMPKVVQDYEQRGGPTIGRWARSNASVLVPMTLLAWLWLASMVPVGRG